MEGGHPGSALHSYNSFQKSLTPRGLRHCVRRAIRKGWGVGYLANRARGWALEAGIMNWRRFATVAALCRTVVLPSWVVVWLAAFGSAGIENIDAASIIDRAPSLAADTESAGAPPAPATDNTPIVHA